MYIRRLFFTFAKQSLLPKILPSKLLGTYFSLALNLSDSKIMYPFLHWQNKARKSGFTQVALNSMLEESAIDFAWEFCWNLCRKFIFQLKSFTKSVFVVFPKNVIISSVVQSSAIWLRIARSAMRTLRSLCAKMQSARFVGSFTIPTTVLMYTLYVCNVFYHILLLFFTGVLNKWKWMKWNEEINNDGGAQTWIHTCTCN